MGLFDDGRPDDGPSYATGPSYGNPSYSTGPSYDTNYSSSDDNDSWGSSSSYTHMANLVDVTTPSGTTYTYHTLSDAIDYVAGNASYGYDEIKAMLSYTDDFDGYRIEY